MHHGGLFGRGRVQLPLLVPKKIGLLGGSFNPAHEGHRAISLFAMHGCRLDQVWWLVTVRNPLKESHDMPSVNDRVAYARSIANHPRCRVMALDHVFGVYFTYEILLRLKYCFPRTRFVWLMGADNLCQLVYWKRWHDIFRYVRIVIMRRYPYDLRAFSSLPAHHFAYCRLPHRASCLVTRRKPPVWTMVMNRFYTISSTELRSRMNKKTVKVADKECSPS